MRPADESSSLLATVGQRVRAARVGRGLTVRGAAESADISVRFWTDLEAGRANIALSRLADVAHALGVALPDVLDEGERPAGPRRDIDRLLDGLSTEELGRCRRTLEALVGDGCEAKVAVALLGLRGAGKSTLGRALADRLRISFVELDDRIEEAAGLGLPEIFSLHGEAYYRRLALRCLADVLAQGTAAVIALPGGIVHDTEAFELVRQRCVTTWLRAKPSDHMNRVLAQGDRRPMAGRPDAMTELVALLDERRPLYAQADVTLDTSDADVDDSAERLEVQVRRAGWRG